MIVKGNILIDQHGNILKVTRVEWDAENKITCYRVSSIVHMTITASFRTSEDIIQGRVRKATREEVRTRIILYGNK